MAIPIADVIRTREVVTGLYSEQIHQSTSGRVHNLQVDIAGPTATVHGTTGSYYIKQLALQAAIEVAGELGHTLEFNVQVGSGSPKRP